MSGAELIMRLLERQGIRTITGIPGGSNLPIYDALWQRGHIRHVLARHEQGAGFIAQGMARTSAEPAVCFATSGPGATNLVTAIADAKLDSVPVIAVTGQVPASMMGTDAFQEVDTYGLSIPVTKHNFLVRSAGELLEVVPEAFRIAASGRPGPVVIDVPKDVQLASVSFDRWPEPGKPDRCSAPREEDIERMAAMIRSAKRPVLYYGGGVISSGAAGALVHFAEKADLPTTSTLMGLGAMPAGHPLFLGMLGMHGARFTNMALDECDLLVATGVRFDDRATGAVKGFCPRASIIHVDIDGAELGKIIQPTLAVRADVAATLDAVAARLPRMRRPAWRARVESLRAEHGLDMPGEGDVMRPYGLIKETARMCEGRRIVVATDVGQHQMWAAQAFPLTRPRQWLTSGGLGTMGFGLPAAIGAALADPEATVLSISGDGSLLMNIQEFATAVEQDVDVKVLLMNNSSLGLVRQQQELFYGGRHPASIFSATPDFVGIARGFGAKAFRLEPDSDPAGTLERALATPGAVLVDVPIATEEMVYPMVAPGAANTEMIGGRTNVALNI